MKKILLGFLTVATILSCSKDRDEVVVENPEASVKVQTVSDLYVPSRMSKDYDPQKYILFNLKDAKEVASEKLDTTEWDIGFNGTTIIVNGGNARKGKGGGLVLDKAYADVKEAPADTEFKGDELKEGKLTLAIPTGSNNGWYTYDMSTHTIMPIKGRTILIKTADAKYAKIQIKSYYKGAPDNPGTDNTNMGYYTFSYSYQTSGSKVFSK